MRFNKSRSQRQLMRELGDGVDAYDNSNNADDAPMITTAIAANKGNPPFDAQFDVQILLKYFSVAAGAYTLRTAAYMLANAAALATVLAFFVFGQSDFQGGYKKLRAQYPLTSTWVYETPFIYGNGYAGTTLGVLDATALAQLQIGDMVQPVTGTNGGVSYAGLVILRCTNVAYGTLLAATNSDSFVVNRIRYIQNDTSANGLLQYNNAIGWYSQSLFGKFSTDSITPNSQKPPEQYQNGVIDIGITKGINKEIAFASYINYDAVSIQWSIFVKKVDKLQA